MAEEAGPQENVFMLRVIPYDNSEEKDDGLYWLVVTVFWYPNESWQNLIEAINNEIQGALNQEDVTLPSTDGMWDLDLTDVWVLWCDPADWWTDMTRITDRNCSAVLDMMRERQHRDALTVRVKFQGQGDIS
jgi:hypothetical protein